MFIVTPIVGVCNCSMFCCTILYVHSSIAIILMGKRELIALLNLSSWCLVMVERLFLAVPLGSLQFVIVVFPDHTHLLFLKLVQVFINVLVTCKNEEDPSKMKALERSQHFFHYKSMGTFSDAQGQLTPPDGFCRISNPSKIVWLSLLPARKKENQSKMKELERSQAFPHYSPMQDICCHGN